MSVSLIVIRLETSCGYQQLDHIQFQSDVKSSSAVKTIEDCNPELRPQDWPLLVSDTLLAMNKGDRQARKIEVSTYTIDTIDDMNSQEGIPKASSVEKSEPVSKKELSSSFTKEGCCDTPDTAPQCSAYKCYSKESSPLTASSKEGTPGPSDDASQASGYSTKGSRSRIPFLSGNPTVDVTHGILHLYKQNGKTSLSPGEERSCMVCMLSVPSSITIHDLLQFTAPCYSGINHIRIIRDSSPSHYMVLIKFKSQVEADEFYSNFNDHPFNTLEPSITSRLVYVARVETTTERKDGGLPIPGHTELPTCPVCLERMDESIDGVLTIVCNHSFHGECLVKWGDTSCPVCRYCQTVTLTDDQQCSECGSKDSLWICLICGHVGCGRYVEGHAHRHFMETNHLFSMQLGNNRVWDYVRDNYVHRLLQSEGDGKVVSYERGEEGSCGRTTEDGLEESELSSAGEEKVSALQLEYTHLLSSQLETQRQYFEDRMAELVMTTSAETAKVKVEFSELHEEISDLQRQITNLSKEKVQADKKVTVIANKLHKVSEDLQTEQHLNLNLRQSKQQLAKKIEEMTSEVQKKDENIKDLEGQLRDMYIHLESTSSVAGNPEMQGASLSLPKPSQTRGRRRKH